MKVGDKWMLYIPPGAGFTATVALPDPARFAADIVIEVELLDAAAGCRQTGRQINPARPRSRAAPSGGACMDLTRCNILRHYPWHELPELHLMLNIARRRAKTCGILVIVPRTESG